MSKNYTSVHHLMNDPDDDKKKQATSAQVTITKEGEPVKISMEKKQQSIEFSETEPKIEDKELENYIKVEKHDPQLDPTLKKAGLSAIDSSSLGPKYKVILPISDEKVMEGLDQPITSSLRWLAEFAVYMLHKAHLTIKKIHGHVVRVIMR